MWSVVPTYCPLIPIILLLVDANYFSYPRQSFKSIAIAMSAFNEVHWVVYSLTELIQMNLSNLGI